MRQISCRNELVAAEFASAALAKRPPELEVKSCLRCHNDAGIVAGELVMTRNCQIATDPGVDEARQQTMRAILGMSTEGFGDIAEPPPPPEDT